MPNKIILKHIREKEFKKIYFLHGEESYFIDEIEQAILEHAIPEAERDFNQTIVYGKDADLLSLISELKNYPMMADRRLVILREAQDFKDLEKLLPYCQDPLESTIFVISHKHKSYDARKKILQAVVKNGLVFKSDKLYESKIADWLQQRCRALGYNINQSACNLLAEFLGTDLGKINNELSKLAIILPKGTEINEAHIEQNIGISKDYNVFELTKALGKRDREKVYKIVNYFDKNPKSNDINALIPQIYKLFSQLMTIHFLPNKNKQAVAEALSVNQFFVDDIINASNQYNPSKIAKNIAILHEYDLRAKGVNNSSTSSGELLFEMVFKLMN